MLKLLKDVGFWAPFLCGVKAQIVRAHLSHLFKWRGVILGQREGAQFVRNIALKERERRRRKAFVILSHPPWTVFQITTADSFIVGSG